MCHLLNRFRVVYPVLAVLCGGLSASAASTKSSFTADLSTSWDDAGGVVAHDVDDDGDYDLIISQDDRIVAYDQNGTKLWRVNVPNFTGGGNTEGNGGVGRFGPNFQVGDVDNDGVTEVIYLVTTNRMKVINGRTGNTEKTIDLPSTSSYTGHWDMCIISNFEGTGDDDILLVGSVNVRTSSNPYRRSKLIAAYRFSDLSSSGVSANALWSRNDFNCQSHGHPIVVDLDLDGRDEVVGGNIISPTGVELVDTGVADSVWNPHIDGISVGDIDPSRPGLECVLVEEGDDKSVILYDDDGVIWHKNRTNRTDGDKVTVGNWDASRSGLEIHFRGADANDMQVWDKNGTVIADYDFDTTKDPQFWTDSGIDNLHRSFWSGGDRQQLAAKERHGEDDIGLMNPMNANFVEVFNESCDRLYTADIRGDWRDELIAISGNIVSIYENTGPNPNAGAPSLWTDPAYRRMHMTHNYYVGVGGGDFVTAPPPSNNDLSVEIDGAPTTLTGLAGYSGNQDETGEGGLTVLPDGQGVRLTGNTWKRYNLNYNVSSSTVLEVTMTLDSGGELAGIGFDNDDDHTNTFNGSPTMVVLDNSNQNVPTDMIDGTSLYGSGTQTVTIPIGAYYTGSINYLTFMADDDRNPAQADVTFDNIRIYEQSGGGGLPTDDFNSGGISGGSGWSGNWNLDDRIITNNGNDFEVASITTSDGPAEGSHHLKLIYDADAVRAADLSGLSSATLTFQWKANSLDNSGETAHVEAWDGSNWVPLLTVNDGQDDNTYRSASIPLPASVLNSNFQLRARLNGSWLFDFFYIDDIEIVTGGSEISEAYVEAEDGSLGSEWGTFSDSGASGGQFIETTASSSTFSSPPGASGIATYNFTNLEAGNYELWGLVTMANGNQDSFWVRVDGGAWAKWNGVGDSNPASSWGWRQVFEQGGGNLVYTLSGNATVEIGYRETGAQLDQLFITKNGNTPQ